MNLKRSYKFLGGVVPTDCTKYIVAVRGRENLHSYSPPIVKGFNKED